MGKTKGFILNRKQYQNIRRIHCQMTLWRTVSTNPDSRTARRQHRGTNQEIRDALQPVKNIGGKRLDTIVNALEVALQAKGQT